MNSHAVVRYREDTGFEKKCEVCTEWLPLALEHWTPKSGLRRCTGCWRIYFRLKERNVRVTWDEARREARRQQAAIRYRMNRAEHAAYMARYREEHRDELREKARIWREQNREKLAAKRAAYYQEAAEVIRMKARERYAAKKAA